MKRFALCFLGAMAFSILSQGVVATERPANATAPTEPKTERWDCKQPIIIRTQLIAIEQTKMRRLGFDFSFFDQETNQPRKATSLTELYDADRQMETESFDGLMTALSKNKLARVFLQQSVMVSEELDWKSMVGLTTKRYYESSNDAQPVGTQPKAVVDHIKQNVVAKPIARDRVLIKVDFERSEPSSQAAKGASQVLCSEFQDTFVVELGKTYVLAKQAKLSGAARANEDATLLLAITPELTSREETSPIQEPILSFPPYLPAAASQPLPILPPASPAARPRRRAE